MSSPKEGAVGGQPTRKGAWMPPKLEEVSARRLYAIHRDDHRHHGHLTSEKKWQYACRILWRSSLKEGAM
jgi:hypothetical protein